jgi:hypothetical protein
MSTLNNAMATGSLPCQLNIEGGVGPVRKGHGNGGFVNNF